MGNLVGPTNLQILATPLGAGKCGGLGRGWVAVESEEAGRGSTPTSRCGAAFELFWEQLWVRIRTGEPGRLVGEGCERDTTRDFLFAISDFVLVLK